MERKTILINSLYCICVINIVALATYALSPFFAISWDGYSRITYSLFLISLPMTILSILVFRLNNIRTRKCRVWLGFAIWTPAAIALLLGSLAVLASLGMMLFNYADRHRG